MGDVLVQQPYTKCNGKAGLAAGTTTTITIANNVDYEIRGKMYRKSAASNGAAPTTDSNTGAAFVGVPINFGCVFWLLLDVSGNLKAAQGGLQALDVSGNFILAPQFPAIPAGMCPIGYLVAKASTGASTWTFGTSNMTGPPAGMTLTFVDGNPPDRPQVA